MEIQTRSEVLRVYPLLILLPPQLRVQLRKLLTAACKKIISGCNAGRREII